MSKITVTTIAGQTSGSDANTVKIESGDTLAVQTNATVGGTLGVTGNTTLSGDLTMGHDGAIINFGADSDITLTHNHNAGLTLTGTGHTFSSDTYLSLIHI